LKDLKTPAMPHLMREYVKTFFLEVAIDKAAA
jgi:hypothetical protein